MSRLSRAAAVAGALGLLASVAIAEARSLDIGRTATAEQIAGWDIDVLPDGAGLPPGRGTARAGKAIYDAVCASCHGALGQGGTVNPGPRLAGGRGTLATAHPEKTVGSYWPFATTLFDYVRRAMPYNAPESLGADQLYGVVAYVLFLNGIIAEDTELNATTLPGIQMPNRNGFHPVYPEQRHGIWR